MRRPPWTLGISKFRAIAQSLLLALAGCLSIASAPSSAATGVFSTLPIWWAEKQSIHDLLNADGPQHWVRAELEAKGNVRALDTLERIPRDMRLLILAQPRPLSPAENVELDKWVSRGGRVLLFADPMLTEESEFALGDKRRPQAVVLLSPILTRWGLELVFDDEQPLGEVMAMFDELAVPTNLAGHFVVSNSRCKAVAEGLIAECRIGRGRVVAVADAAVLESGEGANLEIRREFLRKALEMLN